jgi:hypothetical protein
MNVIQLPKPEDLALLRESVKWLRESVDLLARNNPEAARQLRADIQSHLEAREPGVNSAVVVTEMVIEALQREMATWDA